MAAKDPYRQASGSRLPTPWPVAIRSASAKGLKILEDLEKDILKHLSFHRINVYTLRVYTLATIGFPESAKDTLIVNTTDTNSETWNQAATKIYSIVKPAADLEAIDMRVEIRNPQLMNRDRSTIVPPNSDAHRTFEPLQQAVQQAVDEYLPGRCKGIYYHMRGPPEQTENRTPTILITVEPRTTYSWLRAELNIAQSLQSRGDFAIDIAIEIIPGCFQLSTIPFKEPIPLSQFNLPAKPVNGASIGPRGTPDAGSLCLWVDFEPYGSSQKKKCLLTVYHLIASGDATNRKVNDKDGIGIENRAIKEHIIVDYPAPFDAGPTKKVLTHHIQTGQDKAGTYQQTLDLINRYELLGGIGKVIHASGYRVPSKSGPCYDWALIELNSSIPLGKNQPPLASTFRPMQIPQTYAGINSVIYETKPDEVISQVGSFANAQIVLKVGRSSGVTIGEVNSLKSGIPWQDGRWSTEVDILHLDYPDTLFAGLGDSGSMVLSLQKEWLGMIIGSDIYAGSAFVTPAKGLIDDIKAMTGGTITLS